MRLTTRDLFVAITFAAVIAWCASKVGYASPEFWLSAAVAFMLAAAFVRWTAAERRQTAAISVALPFIGFFTLCIGAIATLVAAVFLVVAAIMLAFRPPSSFSARVRIAMLCVSVTFIYAYIYGNSNVRRILAARQAFPFQSVEDRLSYEVPRATANTPPLSDASILSTLNGDEQEYESNGWRAHQLRLIHSVKYEQFMRAAGFGPVRMIRPRTETLVRVPLRDIGFDDAEFTDDEFTPNWRAGGRGLATGAVQSAHEVSRRDFLDAEGFGYVQTPRTAVAGFVEHAFHQNPLAGDKLLSKWRLQRLELVSLLKFETPRVYVLDHLPRMDQLNSNDIPTRASDEFESDSLAKLQANADVIVSHDGNEYRMLGSLRAAKQCLDCHNVQRGELLGAFSYRLTLADEKSEEAPLAVSDTQP
ncbi:hypothetical protein [Lacipirellula parvula]|uniref:Uncharacterized protein n=1 Tax=Lacipirellula parvula TaxID=2650471 RepID=A0A5K7XNP1_9BACT|nr:hypothetical protein [Lacipirellula parvula]BBO34809.1 hypothetical protein PLANPX_4421 [Lacipirellula parvula]